MPVVTTDETGGLARSFNQMSAGLAEREEIREAFSERHTAPEVVATLNRLFDLVSWNAGYPP